MEIQLYETLLNATFLLSIPCNIGILYMMSLMKWNVTLKKLSLMFFASILYMQLVVTKLTAAVFFSPRNYGFVTGWLADAPLYVSGVVYISAIPPVPIVGCIVVYYRQQKVLPMNSKFRLSLRQNIILWTIVITTVVISPLTTTFLMNLHTPEVTRQLYHTLPPVLQERYRSRPASVFAYNEDDPFFLMSMVSYPLAIGVMVAFGGALLIATRRTFRKHFTASDTTRRLQREFMRILLIQMSTLVICMGGSILIMLIPVVFRMSSMPQELNLFAALLIAQISPSTLIMILIGMKKVRKELWARFLQRINGKLPTSTEATPNNVVSFLISSNAISTVP